MYISLGRIFHGGVKMTVNVVSVIGFGSTRGRRPLPKEEPKRVSQRPAAKVVITMPKNAVFKRVPMKSGKNGNGGLQLQSQSLLPDGRTLVLVHESDAAEPDPNVWVPLEPGVGEILHVGEKRVLVSCRWCITRGLRLFE